MTEKREVSEAELEASMPKVVGYKVLVALPPVEDTHDGLIVKSAQAKHIEEVYTVVGRVIDIGPDAYKDAARFPSGPWCKLGDWVVFRALSGSRFKVFGQEVRVLNDDSIEGVVADPRGIERAY